MKRAIGPTVARLAKEIGTGSLIALTGETFHDEANRVAVQIEACWADLYGASTALPRNRADEQLLEDLYLSEQLTAASCCAGANDRPLKVVLGTLYWAVRHHHASTKE